MVVGRSLKLDGESSRDEVAKLFDDGSHGASETQYPDYRYGCPKSRLMRKLRIELLGNARTGVALIRGLPVLGNSGHKAKLAHGPPHT